MQRDSKDFDAEIRAHIALEAERLKNDGMSPQDAEAAARRAFGNATLAQEQFYESGRLLWWDELRRDFAYAIRTLRHNPIFTIAAVLTLAIGIGANTAIFSLIDEALLRPLPYPNPERIVVMWSRTANGGDSSLSPATFLDFRQQASCFEPLAAFREMPFNLEALEHPERIEGVTVTPDFFAVLGVDAFIGRTLNARQDAPGSPRTVVLSYALWQRLYAGNRDAVGKTIQMDGEVLTIAGVMPARFQYPPGVMAWRAARHRVPENPLRPDVDQSNSRDSHYFSTIARLKPGLTITKATAETDAIAARIKQRYGSEEELARATLVNLQEDMYGETRPALLMLLGAVCLLLLISCANVANILLARGATRQREIAIRGALGAGRARLIRQFLTESVTIGLAGGALGILFAHLSLAPMRTLLPADTFAGATLGLDGRVLGFTAVLSILCSILFGLFPAFQAARFDLHSVLKEAGRGSASGPRAQRARSALVVSEIALAGVLLIGAGLLLRSFNRLLGAPEGFEPERVMSMQISLPNARYAAPEKRARFVREVLERMSTAPGVQNAAAISRLPLNPGASSRSLDVKGRPQFGEGQSAPDYLVVTPQYFQAMGIRVSSGRVFTENDGPGAASAVIVNQALAKLWNGQDPIGQFVQVGGCGSNEKDWCQVVGVVDDVKQHGLDQVSRPAVYVPYAKDPWPFMAFVVRAAVEPSTLASAMTGAVQSVDREQPVYNVRTMREVVSHSLSAWKLRMELVGMFASLALALACVGIYGVMAYSVAQRTQEIGIRIALGASRMDVVRGVVGHALRLSLAGVGVGAILSFGMTRFLSRMLYGVAPTDAMTFGVVCALTIVTALIASGVPALRATKVDPLTALRAQ